MRLGTIEERVARGVAVLDAYDPSWVDKIDLETLNLMSCGNCVLGQWASDYVDGVLMLQHVPAGSPRYEHDRLLYEEDVWAMRHGFESARIISSDEIEDPENIPSYVEYRKLDAEWTRVITERRADIAAALQEAQQSCEIIAFPTRLRLVENDDSFARRLEDELIPIA